MRLDEMGNGQCTKKIYEGVVGRGRKEFLD